jgi:predicted DNA-binding transcriptional regulator AlpA
MKTRLVLSQAEVRVQLGLSRNALERLIASGALKAPILLSPRRKAHLVSDIEDFLSARAAMRDASDRPAHPCA